MIAACLFIRKSRFLNKRRIGESKNSISAVALFCVNTLLAAENCGSSSSTSFVLCIKITFFYLFFGSLIRSFNLPCDNHSIRGTDC